MPSAVDFFPACINEFVNLATSLSLNFGSGMIFRLGTSRRRGMVIPLRLGTLHAVLGALAVAVGLVGGARPRRARRVERAADDVVANSGQILHAAAADEHHAVLLQVV